MVAEMGGDPHTPGRTSVTLKGDGKDATWIVFHGSPAEIRSQIKAVFEIEGEEGAPLFDLINEATRLFKSSGNINSTLGGRVVGKSGGSTPSGNGGSAWDRAANGEGQQEEPVDINVVRLTKAIEEASDVDTLKLLYARDKAHFDGNAELFAAWQAKGQSLS